MIKASQWYIAIAGYTIMFTFLPLPGLALSPVPPETISVTCRFDQPQFTLGPFGYSTVSIKDCSTTMRAGWPLLPFRVVRLLLPPRSSVTGVLATPRAESVVMDGNWLLDFGRQPLSPGRQLLATPVSEQPAVYRSSEPIPANRIELVSVQHMAGYDIAILRAFPLVYTPISGRLVFAPVLDLSLILTNRLSGLEVMNMRATPIIRARDRDRILTLVDNPDRLTDYDALNTSAGNLTVQSSPIDYLLVTKQSLLPAFQPLVNRKTADGLAVRTETMENINTNYPGRDSAEKLRNYIRYAYTNWGIEYVLLGGDTATVPCRLAYGYCAGASDQIPCDLYFACLDGSWNRDNNSWWGEPSDGDGGGDVDLLAEVYVGRAPVDTPEETSNFVFKVVQYETSGVAHPFQALNAGEYLGSGNAQGGAALDRLIPAMSNGSFRVNWLDDRPFELAMWSKDDCLTLLNQSPHLIFHEGHADATTVLRLVTPNLDSLTNSTPFLFYSAGCDAGAFDNDIFSPDCIGEELVKRNKAGAVAAILNSRLGWFDASKEWKYSGEFQESFLNQLLTQGNTTLGKAHQLAKQAMVGLVETSGNMPYRWCYFDLVLFGDPHMPLFTPIVMGLTGLDDHIVPSAVVQWNSLSNRIYSVQRTTNMTFSGFACLSSNITATPPLNSYTDSVSGVEKAFYRISADR